MECAVDSHEMKKALSIFLNFSLIIFIVDRQASSQQHKLIGDSRATLFILTFSYTHLIPMYNFGKSLSLKTHTHTLPFTLFTMCVFMRYDLGKIRRNEIGFSLYYISFHMCLCEINPTHTFTQYRSKYQVCYSQR